MNKTKKESTEQQMERRIEIRNDAGREIENQTQDQERLDCFGEPGDVADVFCEPAGDYYVTYEEIGRIVSGQHAGYGPHLQKAIRKKYGNPKFKQQKLKRERRILLLKQRSERRKLLLKQRQERRALSKSMSKAPAALVPPSTPSGLTDF